MASVFSDTVRAKARQISTMTSIILASPRGDREIMHASSTYSIPHTAQRKQSITGSVPIDIVVFFRCTSSARMTVSSLNLWRTTVSTTAKKMLDKNRDSTHPSRSPCSISNQSKQTPSSGHTKALIPSWNCRMTAILCGGTPMRVSTCHRWVRSTVSQAF